MKHTLNTSLLWETKRQHRISTFPSKRVCVNIYWLARVNSFCPVCALFFSSSFFSSSSFSFFLLTVCFISIVCPMLMPVITYWLIPRWILSKTPLFVSVCFMIVLRREYNNQLNLTYNLQDHLSLCYHVWWIKNSYTPCLNKNCTNYFCHNFVKFKSILTIFGR